MSVSPLINSFLKATRAYLLPIPYSRQNMMKQLAQNLAFAVIAQQALHAGLGLILYPGIEEKFAELGISEAELKGLNIPAYSFVRPPPEERTFIDHLYAMTDAPTIAGVLYGIQKSFDVTSGSRAIPYPACDITLSQIDGLSKRFISANSLISEDMLSNDIISDKDAAAMILAHETGHCHWDMHIPLIITNLWQSVITDDFSMLIERQFWQAELYSDYVAIAFADDIEDPDRSKGMKDYMIAARAASQYYIWNADTGLTYDHAMVLASGQWNYSPPTIVEIAEARRELADFIHIHIDREKDYIPSLLNAVQGFLSQEEPEISDYAAFRAELYLNAVAYLAPGYREIETASLTETPTP